MLSFFAFGHNIVTCSGNVQQSQVTFLFTLTELSSILAISFMLTIKMTVAVPHRAVAPHKLYFLLTFRSGSAIFNTVYQTTFSPREPFST